MLVSNLNWKHLYNEYYFIADIIKLFDIKIEEVTRYTFDLISDYSD